jgi:hypothetical protein
MFDMHNIALRYHVLDFCIIDGTARIASSNSHERNTLLKFIKVVQYSIF